MLDLATAPRVAVVGSGYVGTVVAACFAVLGRHVIGVDVDERKVDLLRRGAPPFYEPGLDELLRSGLRCGRLSFTASIEEAVRHSDVLFLCVGTPSTPEGTADMRSVAEAAAAIGRSLDRYHVLVSKSTVPIGSAHWLASVVEDALPAHVRGEHLFSVVSNPEFLREGSAIEDFLVPDRLVLGSDDDHAIDVVREVYRPILEQSFTGGLPDRRPPLVRTTLATAETVKYASNAFLATKVSFINEIANICELVGADVAEVATVLGLDHRIGSRFLDAGVGWGGSCFGKDIKALISTAADYGYDTPLLRAAAAVNARQRRVVVEKLRRQLRILAGKRIGLLGLAFKPGTDDLRDAPALEIAEQLLAAGAVVTAHDPMVTGVPNLPLLRLASTAYEAADRADALVLVTEWQEYQALEFDQLRKRMRGELVIDGRNFLDPLRTTMAGLRHVGIGRDPVSTLEAVQQADDRVRPFASPAAMRALNGSGCQDVDHGEASAVETQDASVRSHRETSPEPTPAHPPRVLDGQPLSDGRRVVGA